VRLAAARIAARWWALPALLALGIYLGLLVRTEYAFPRNSDTAWAALAGQDLLAGNWNLSGWTLTAYPAWTTEIPAYALAVAIGGLGAWLMYVPPALFYATTVILAAALAAFGGSRRAAAVTAALLALPTPYLANLGGQPGAHMPTVTFGMAALLMLAAGLRGRWWATAAGSLLLAAAVAGDGLALPAFAAPVAAASLLVAALARSRVYLWTGLGAVAGTAAGLALRTPSARPGGFNYIDFSVHVIGRSHLLPNLRLTWTIVLSLLGSDHPWGQLVGIPSALILGVACALAGLLAARRLAGRPKDLRAAWLDATLLACIAGNFASFVLTDRPQDIMSGRYLLPAAACAAVLIGRHLVAPARRPLRSLALVAALILLAVRTSAFLVTAATPAPVPDHAQLESWLEARGLELGYGSYWDASVVTVETGGRVQIRNVEGANGRLRPQAYLSKSDWYRPESNPPARFVVFPASGDGFGVDQATATATFGAPSETDTVGPYLVLIWDEDLAPKLARAGA